MKFVALIATLAFVGSFAFAQDAEHAEKDTVKHSKNVLTGTKTTEVKHKKKVKNAHGEANATETDTTKVHTNGEVEHEKKVDTDSKTN